MHSHAFLREGFLSAVDMFHRLQLKVAIGDGEEALDIALKVKLEQLTGQSTAAEPDQGSKWEAVCDAMRLASDARPRTPGWQCGWTVKCNDRRPRDAQPTHPINSR
jgi:hypothetical protein